MRWSSSGLNDVLELAGVGVGFGFGEVKRVGEQTLGETAAANDVARAIFTLRGERDFVLADFEKSEALQARDDGRRIANAVVLNALDFGDRTLFARNPNLLEKVIKLNFIFG